ncbi:membrane protein, partial [Streptomyces viridochromogenes]
MTDQPYQGYDGYDPYQQPAQHPAQHPAHQQAPQAWPGQQAYDEQQAAAQQYTQQWQGQTWETHVQPPVAPGSAAETSYLPSQGAGTPGVGAYAGYGGPQAQAQAQAQAHAQARSAHAQAQAPRPRSEPEREAESGEDPGYGPATVAGNARITDAQRARLEGRSPIIEPGIQPAGLTALLGLLLSGAAAIGSYALLVPLVALQAVTAAGWFRLNGMWPARQGIALAFAGALTADVALLASGRAPAAILGTLGVWVLLTLVLQLRSHADPDERMYGLMATVASAALSIIAGGYLAAEADAVSVGAVAVAVAVLVRALPLPTPVSVVVALLAAAGAGGVVGAMTGVGSGGALLGAGVAACALIGHRVASYDYPSRFVHFTAGVALPLAAAAPAVY